MGHRFYLLIPLLVVGGAVAISVWLGLWQIDRRAWKQELQARISARATAEPVTLAQVGDDSTRFEHHRVIVEGRFLHDRELYLMARTHRGRAGLDVVTPLILADGRHLLIDRGWVPMPMRPPSSRSTGQTAGIHPITATLRLAGGPGRFTPANDPARNDWYYVDVPAMSRAAGLDPDRALPFYLVATPVPNPGGYPIGRPASYNLPNSHLQYAVTWFSMAVALTVAYVVFLVQRRRMRQTEDES